MLVEKLNVEEFMKEQTHKEKERIKMLENQAKKGCLKCSQWDEYFGCTKCEE